MSEQIMHSKNSRKHLELSLQIPPRPIDSSENSNLNGNGSLHSYSSSSGSSSARGFFRGRSFKNQISTHDESSSLLDSGLSATTDRAMVPENASLANYIAKLAWKRCVSLPVTHGSKLSPSVSSPAKEVVCSEHHPSHVKFLFYFKCLLGFFSCCLNLLSILNCYGKCLLALLHYGD